MLCDKCKQEPIAKGITKIKCSKCEKEKFVNVRYKNICYLCSKESNICQMCGEIIRIDDYVWPDKFNWLDKELRGGEDG